jgi:hypothetical protein
MEARDPRFDGTRSRLPRVEPRAVYMPPPAFPQLALRASGHGCISDYFGLLARVYLRLLRSPRREPRECGLPITIAASLSLRFGLLGTGAFPIASDLPFPAESQSASKPEAQAEGNRVLLPEP